jgi:hypothetical protein
MMHHDTQVIDLQKVSTSPSLPKKEVPYDKLTDVGVEVMERGHGEAKARYGGDIPEHDLFLPLLDHRLMAVPHYTEDEKASAKVALKNEYVTFKTVAAAHSRAKMEAQVRVKVEAGMVWLRSPRKEQP